jgi:hypothetical protein
MISAFAVLPILSVFVVNAPHDRCCCFGIIVRATAHHAAPAACRRERIRGLNSITAEGILSACGERIGLGRTCVVCKGVRSGARIGPERITRLVIRERIGTVVTHHCKPAVSFHVVHRLLLLQEPAAPPPNEGETAAPRGKQKKPTKANFSGQLSGITSFIARVLLRFVASC